MSGLHEPFDTLPRQREAAEVGIWIFLATEVIFFGGLFMGYSAYRFLYPEGYLAAGAETNIVIGTANTAILLTSSATMAVAVWAGRADAKGQVLIGLCLTLLLGAAFLALKGVEYAEDVHKSLVPGPAFPIQAEGAEIFFSFYWIMTAVHAVHLVIGVCALTVSTWRIWRNALDWQGTAFLHVLGLYWHLIDLIWIFLFPLLYLLGRGG